MKCKYRRWVHQYLLCYVCAPNQWKFMSNPEIRGNLGLRAYPTTLVACLHHPHLYIAHILLHIQDMYSLYSTALLHLHWMVIGQWLEPQGKQECDCRKRRLQSSTDWLQSRLTTDRLTGGSSDRCNQGGGPHHGQLAPGLPLPLISISHRCWWAPILRPKWHPWMTSRLLYKKTVNCRFR